MQSDTNIKLEKVLLKIAFVSQNRLIDLSVSDYNTLNRATGSEIVTVSYNNGINLHQLCRNEMEIVNYHNAKKKDKILRKIKALKAKLKSSPSARRSNANQAHSEPVACNMAFLSNHCVESLVESHIQEECSEARNLTNFQNVFTELSFPGSDIGNQYSNINISVPMNEIPFPSSIEVNVSNINSYDNIIPPRVEVDFEESAERPPEMVTPDINDFGDADLQDILSLGFDQNIGSSIEKVKQTNYQSTDVLHHSSDLQPRSNMREDVTTPQILLHGDGLRQSMETPFPRPSLHISTQLSPVVHQILENTSVALSEFNRTPNALAAPSFIIPPFSGIEQDDSLSPTNDPQPAETHFLITANSGRQLIFNNIQESLQVQTVPQRRRRVLKVNDYYDDFFNSVDEIMLLQNIPDISESILIIPHKNPSDLKNAQINDVDLTFEFDLLKISKDITCEPTHSNLPIVPSTGPLNSTYNAIQQRPSRGPLNSTYNAIQQRPSTTLPDNEQIYLRPSITSPDYEQMHPQASTPLPETEQIHQRLSTISPAYVQMHPQASTPLPETEQMHPQASRTVLDNIEVNILNNLAHRKTASNSAEGQSTLEKVTPFQKQGITSKNIYSTPRISNLYDEPEGIRRMTMNTFNEMTDLSQNVQHYNVDRQQNTSRFSDLCEVQIPQCEEVLAPTDNVNIQRLLTRDNELDRSQVPKPSKEIIHRGQKYIQLENDLKISVYFLELTYLYHDIQQLFVSNGVHTMDADDVIDHCKNDKINAKCIKIRLLNLFQNNLINITDDADREIAFINIPFFGETVE